MDTFLWTEWIRAAGDVLEPVHSSIGTDVACFLIK
jgi:hypothetical protein